MTAVLDFAARPVATLKGVRGGVDRLFKRTNEDFEEGVQTAKEGVQTAKEMGKEVAEVVRPGGGSDGKGLTAEETRELARKGAEAGEKAAYKYLGVSGAERRWAEKLGVDPYTSNEILRREIRKVARVDALGGLAIKMAGVPEIPGANYIRKINRLVWATDPRELRKTNAGRLGVLGASAQAIEGFFANPFYSPSQTLLVALLDDLEGVEDRATGVLLAAGAESDDEARFFVQTVQMLAGYHRGQRGLERLTAGDRLPVGLTADGRLGVAAPLEQVFWVEGIADSDGVYHDLARELGIDRREIWIRGGASARCQRELVASGWSVHVQGGSSFDAEGE